MILDGDGCLFIRAYLLENLCGWALDDEDGVEKLSAKWILIVLAPSIHVLKHRLEGLLTKFLLVREGNKNRFLHLGWLTILVCYSHAGPSWDWPLYEDLQIWSCELTSLKVLEALLYLGVTNFVSTVPQHFQYCASTPVLNALVVKLAHHLLSTLNLA